MGNIKELRKAAGLTQVKLARQSGVSRFRICMAETESLPLRPEEVEAINRAVAPELEKTLRVASTFQGVNCVAS
jgi:DNA-binding XRE family transcriptional regulator